MSDLICCTIFTLIWIGSPAWRLAAAAERIADELKKLRELAERGRR